MGVGEDSTLPYLLELLSVNDSGFDQINMSPEGKRHQTIEALKRIALKGSEVRPLVMAIEDLHWADKSSEDTLKYLLESIAGSRVFLVLTYRPEFVPTWTAKTFHNQVTLNRLSNRESLAMVSHLLGTEEIDSTLQEVILEKTEGIPFFIEEMIKSLKDMGVVEKRDNRYGLSQPYQEIAVPSTIQDVIMARVDSLPEGAKEVLQTGSVIEREFGHELIQRTTGLPDKELFSHLSLLKDAELLYERGVYPRLTYIFKHALTRDVVYDSILARRKKRLHGDVGDGIEELHKDSIAQHYGVLADHYIAGENYEKGAIHSRFAERRAEKAGAINDAIAFGEKRIECLERLPVTEDTQRKVIDARTTLGLYYLQAFDPLKAKQAIDPIMDTALEIGYKKRLSQLLTILGVYLYFVQRDPQQAIEKLEAALEIAEEEGNIVSVVFAKYWLATILVYQCEFESALYHYEKALEINIEAGSLWGISVTKCNMALACAGMGEMSKALEISTEAVEISEQSGDFYSKAQTCGVHQTVLEYIGFLAESENAVCFL
ncbi:hypothetical protein ACFL0Q_05700 [Thermodesulfobacteriota bacterium]